MKPFAILISLMVGSVAAISLTSGSVGPVSQRPAVIVSGSTTPVALNLDGPDWDSYLVCHDVEDVLEMLIDYYNPPVTPPNTPRNQLQHTNYLSTAGCMGDGFGK